MSIIESFGAYIDSQRAVSTNFILLCGILIIIAIVVHFAFPSTSFALWFKRSLVVGGVLIALGGFSYGNFNKKVLESGHTLYENNPTEFAKTEEVRMEKVVKQFPYYQITFAIFVLISLIIILFIPSPIAKGIAFSTAVLFIGCMAVEQVSHSSILDYFEALSLK